MEHSLPRNRTEYVRSSGTAIKTYGTVSNEQSFILPI